MDKPFAITLDAGSSLANKTGSLAHRAAGLRRPAAAVQPRLPGRREHPGAGSTTPRRAVRLRARLAHDHGGQPVPRGHGPGLLPPVRDRLQPRPARRGGRASTRSSGSSATRRSGRAGPSTSTRRPPGRRVLVVGAGPVRPLRGLPPARGSGTTVTVREAGPMAGRDDALRHPALPPAARRPRRRDRSGSSTSASTLELDTKVTDLRRRDGRRRVRRGLPRRRRPARQAGLHPGRLGRARARRGRACCTTSRTASSRCSAAGSRSTAAATPRSTPPAPPSGSAPTEAIVVYRRTRDRMPAHDIRGRRRPRRRACCSSWLTTINQVDAGTLVVERMELDESGFPQPTGELEELDADSLVLALGQETDLVAARRRARRWSSRTASSTVGPGPDDRVPRGLRRRRHGARRALGHGRGRARQAGRAAASTPGCAGAAPEPSRAPRPGRPSTR